MWYRTCSGASRNAHGAGKRVEFPNQLPDIAPLNVVWVNGLRWLIKYGYATPAQTHFWVKPLLILIVWARRWSIYYRPTFNCRLPDFLLKVGDLDLPRLGAKSAENLIQAIEISQITLPVCHVLSIPQWERDRWPLAQNFQTLTKNKSADVLTLNEGIGPVVAGQFAWFTIEIASF